MKADKGSRADAIAARIVQRSDWDAAFNEEFGKPGTREGTSPRTLRDAVRRRLDEYRAGKRVAPLPVPDLAQAVLPPLSSGHADFPHSRPHERRPRHESAPLIFSSEINNAVNCRAFESIEDGAIYRVEQHDREKDFTGIFVRRKSYIGREQEVTLSFDTGTKLVRVCSGEGGVLLTKVEAKKARR